MSSLECNSSSANLKKTGQGIIKPLNGRLLQCHASTNPPKVGIKSNSRIDASIYKESNSPIVAEAQFGTNQTIEDSINKDFGDFQVDFFNYPRLIELATTIDPNTGNPELEPWKYYKLLIFLIINFGYNEAYSLFTPPDRQDSGTRYTNLKASSRFTTRSIKQTSRRAYNDPSLKSQIVAYLGGQSKYNEKVAASGFAAIDTISNSLYAIKTPLNHHTHYIEPPRVLFAGAGTNDNNRIQIPSYDNSAVRASLAFKDLSVRSKISGQGVFNNRYTDKIGGHYSTWEDNSDFEIKQRLYPIEDIVSSKAGVSFVNEKLEPSGLYKSIDDSIVFGDYARDRKRLGKLHSDDNTTYITPSSIHTAGTFRYQCEVTPPVITPKDNFLFIRAAAPTSTNETDITPVYKAYNIHLTDPLGNVITRYKDFVIEGDCDYDVDPKSNFTTYIIEPDKNYAALPTYYSKFPDFTQRSGYKLNIEFEAFCKATPFEDEFSRGYEHECTLEERYVDTDEDDHLAIDGSPISSINQDFDIFPNNSLRISDIEILSDGSNSGFISEGILELSLTPQLNGTLLERNIFALDLLNGTEFVNPIHPSDNDSVWKTSPNYNGIEHFSSSADRFSRSQLRDRLRNQTVAGNITLVGTGPTGSGRLEVLFGHETPLKVLLPTGGGIGFGSKYQGVFDKSEKNFVQADDSYFEVEELYLQVKAKKVDSTVPDIFFDVVGYSDDKVMMVTSSPNGFIQNQDAGVGLPPLSSGYKPLDDLAIAGESLSEKDNYFVSRSPSRGDHYTLTKQPKITSTDFQTIDIPLKMHKDAGFLGQDKSFTSSSFFEKLYVDIFPLPSGTVISELILKAKYNPTAGMMMYTLGHKQDTDLRHTEVRLSPSGIQHPYNNTNQIISSGSRLSLIENIPHAYGQDSTLKTNYARRWRGSEGTFFAGPFDPTMWSFSYFNPQVDSAFTYFHTDFSDFENNTIYSQVTDDSVVYNGDLANNHLKNRGLRFISDKIFDNQIPDYKTLDWTQDSDVMAGRIMDSYNNAVKVVGSSGCMNFGSGIPVSGGFSAFTRFVPDVSVSGADYNLFNSGVIFSKWDQGKDLEFILGYDDGKLTAKATDKDNNIISINDTISFDKYQYPLSVLLTYNDNNSKKLKLYTNNEIIKGKFDIKRAESSEFDLINGDSDLVFGYSYGSGVGFNAYFNEIGLSDSNELGGNIVEGAANPSIRQGNVDTFFDSHSVKFFHSGESLDNDSNNLWKFVDEDTRKWHIGAFKYCEFNSSFDTLTNRQGSDYIYHDYYGDSSTYSEITDISLPSNLKLEGVAYHSQIENDMLRINLAGVEDEFFAAAPRISKNIPRNYNILEDAVRVNTVLQNLCNADVVWPDGNVGVKIIVSLYTKSKESSFRESTNFGLVNRKVHYVTPEDCWLKVHSDLSYDDIVRNDEPWSNFVTEQISKESKESYFVDDISKMFIQYDIAYPSGSFHSVIRMNSIDVTIGDMLVEKGTRLQDMPLYASGDLEYRERLNLSVFKAVGSPEERLDLYVSGAQPIELSDDLHMSVPYPSVLVDDRLYVMINYLQQVGSPFPTDQSFSNFGSQHYDSYREFVELLLKFDSSFDDLSSNDYSISSLSNTQLPTMDSSNAKYGLSAMFGNGSSIHVPDFTFDPEKFNGDWLIDFWLYLPDYAPSLLGEALGIKDVDTILDFSSNVFMGFGNNNNKDIGFKIGIDPDSKNLTLTTNMLNNVEGFNSLPDDRVLEIMSDKATSLGTQSSVSVSSNANYFHNFEFKFVSSKNISDLRGRWTKVIIRKSQNILDIYCGAESNGTYTLDSSLLFDTVDTSSHSYPSLRSVNNDNSIPYGLDDLRFTLGSSRGAGNPGIDLSTAPDPSIQPPVEPPVDPDDPTVCKIYKTPPYDFCHISDPRVYLKTVPLFVDCGNNIASNIKHPFPLSITCFADNVNASIPLFAKMDLNNFKEKSTLNLSLGRAIFIDFVRSKNADLNLSVQAPDGDKDFNTSIPLYVGGYTYDDVNSSFELFLLHESPIYQDPNDPKLENFEWTGTNTGSAIEVRDNPLAAIPADDEIRGVDTICFGSCDYVSQYPCTEPDLITHDTVWFTSECFEGGIFRSFTHYTNPDVMAFGGNYPYLRNYYGMRKFGGLIPQNPYEITISIFSGSSEVLEVPKEITEWEYGINDDVNYQPDKIITDTPVAGLNFGKSVAVNDDLMVVGVPNQELADSTGHSMPKCGELHVYRRDPAPSGFDWGYQEDKAPWSLEAKLSVPAEYRRDKFTNESKSFRDQDGQLLPFQGVMRNWEVTQNGRELGYSVDCTKDEYGNEIIVAGGPGAVFDRGFAPVNSNPVEIALFIITNEFNPNLNPQPILDALQDKDLLYKYFSDPAVEFSVKVIICEAILGTNVESGGEIPEPKPSFVSQHKIHRHTRYDISTQAYKDKENLIVEDLKNIFEEEYPLTPNVLNSGLPALLSVYLDTSVSLGKRAMGQDKVVGKGALDKFIDYFKEYTYDNGLQNVFTPPVAASGYGHITYDRTEGWIDEGGKALDEITDTGRMIETNTFTLFANNLGTFNSSASEFNNPPPSGGAVYVFQKPSGTDYWHIIQEINSPTRKKDDVPDRFGHAVSISDDGKVIAIGSPYSEHNVKILQSMEINGKPTFDIDQTIGNNILPWLLDNYHDTLYLQLRELLTASADESLTKRDFYDNVLSDDQKYNFFVNYILGNRYSQPYDLIKSLDSSVGSGGWGRMYNELIPTQRMGYSIDVNEDGSAIAIGCPTDSLGARDNTLTAFRYYTGTGFSNLGDLSHHWQNYSYAGAVRLLEARKYYPHNKVVEYGKFGNLHETIHRDENNDDLFSDFRDSIYHNMGIDYVKTNFVDTEIPSDAGVLYIITPEIDAASEEIIEKIKAWLSLGDRNLVLVGDDPFYEANSRYESSNDIVNYILERLDINLRIFPARTEYEARVNPEKFDNLKLNAVGVPKLRTTTPDSVYRGTLAASGVGDIRLFDENINRYYSCFWQPDDSSPFALIGCKKKPYRKVNNRCNMPITHLGDLRAEWNDQCIFITPKGCAVITYPVNAAYVYGSTNEDYFGCYDWEIGPILPENANVRDKSEPIPLIAAAEKLQRTIEVEPVPPSEYTVQVKIGETSENIRNRKSQSIPNSGTKFVWTDENPEYANLILNLNNIDSQSLFYDPLEYDETNAILAANASVKNRAVPEDKVVGKAVFAAEQEFGDAQNPSIVTLIAGTYTEDRDRINDTQFDQGYNFYGNILRYVDKPTPKLALLKGFTGRNDFQDGYKNSAVPSILEAFGIESEYNVETSDLINDSKGYDIVWIANSLNTASDIDIANIKAFIEKGNKKVIITYGHAPEQVENDTATDIEGYSSTSLLAASVASDLCDRLGLAMKPLFLPTKNHYAAKNDTNATRTSYSTIYANRNSRAYQFGTAEEDKFELYTFRQFNESTGKYYSVNYPQNFIPIQISENSASLALFGGNTFSGSYNIVDDTFSSEGSPIFRTGITKVTFDLPEIDVDNGEDEYNLYQIVFDLVSETEYERHPINAYIDAHVTSSLFSGTRIGDRDGLSYVTLPIPDSRGTQNISDIDDEGNTYLTGVEGSQVELYCNSSTVEQKSVMAQIPTGQTQLDIYFEAIKNYPYEVDPDPLRTIRIVGISGVRVPTIETNEIIKSPIYGTETRTRPGSPGYSYEVDYVRPISTESSKYCPSKDSERSCDTPPPTGYDTPGPDIADGPVVVAQSIYHQGGYFSGHNKSRVTVISDASLIQGDNIIIDKNRRITSPALPPFLASLYPTDFFDTNESGDNSRGWTYANQLKIISPERGSPSRYINSYPHISGLNSRFGGHPANNPMPHSYFSDDEGSYDLNPQGALRLINPPNREMLGLLEAMDEGKFYKLPEELQKSPAEVFAEGNLWNGMTQEEYEHKWYYTKIYEVMEALHADGKLLDTYNGVSYRDAGMNEVMPPILRETGYDHLDIEHFGSGYPGDLFGFSVKFHKGDLYVGAPFAAYTGTGIKPWSQVIEEDGGSGSIDGIELGSRGGAGIVYRLEDTKGVRKGSGSKFGQLDPANNISWAFKEKIQPSKKYVGHDNQTPQTASGILGDHVYTQSFLNNHFGMPDMFGYHIDAAGDVLAVSAPGHDFDIVFENINAPFIRKEFNEQFNIQDRIKHDLAIDSVRAIANSSGVNIINRGSIFTYENRITDWGSKTQGWTPVHKITTSGHNTRLQSENSNSYFGQSFALDRAFRTDSDYVLVVGNKHHQFNNTDNVATSGAGAVFSYDGMLRRLRPAFSHPNTYIDGKVFSSGNEPIEFRVENANEFNKLTEITGVILSNKYGEIFLEASGFDSLERSYAVNRPYVHSIIGTLKRGTPAIQYGRLFVEGSPFFEDVDIDLFVKVKNQLEVYNKLELYTQSAYFASGEMPLFASGQTPTDGELKLYTSGWYPPSNNELILHTQGF